MRRMFSGLLAGAFVPLAAFAQINSNFFGLAISGNAGVAWPSNIAQPLAVSTVRLWDSGTRWDQLETSNGVYAWGPLDIMLSQAKANNQTVLYTFGGVPSFVSSNPDDTACAEGNGSCDPPSGLNGDGSGKDVQFKAFVTALMIHTGNQIAYFEPWNEVNNTPFWNGSAAQIVRMVSDARTIIKSFNPSAVVLTPSTCACYNGPFTGWTSLSSNPQDGMEYYLGTSAAGRDAPTGASLADGIAIHTYVGANPPENILLFINGTKTAMEEQGVGSLPLYITEDSWGPNTLIAGCSSAPPFNQECLDTASAFVIRSLALAASNDVSAYYWYAWGNSSHGTLYNASNGTLYQPGNAYAQIRTWLTGTTSLSPCSNKRTVYTCEFTRTGGFQAMLVWDTSQTAALVVPPAHTRFRSATPPSMILRGAHPYRWAAPHRLV